MPQHSCCGLYTPTSCQPEALMPDLPLSGLRVLDLGQVYAGPTCARILCDLGAEVIKIEGLNRIDITRNFAIYDNQTQDDYWNRSHYFLFRNAGKKSLTLDFQEPRSIELFKRLAPHAHGPAHRPFRAGGGDPRRWLRAHGLRTQRPGAGAHR